MKIIYTAKEVDAMTAYSKAILAALLENNEAKELLGDVAEVDKNIRDFDFKASMVKNNDATFGDDGSLTIDIPEAAMVLLIEFLARNNYFAVKFCVKAYGLIIANKRWIKIAVYGFTASAKQWLKTEFCDLEFYIREVGFDMKKTAKKIEAILK